jgi:hypothetical protein
LSKLLDKVLEVVAFISFLSIFSVQDGAKEGWGRSALFDSKEGVLMVEALFAACTVVKVFADTALVTDSLDWVDSASIT